jgi:hypothetical protein
VPMSRPPSTSCASYVRTAETSPATAHRFPLRAYTATPEQACQRSPRRTCCSIMHLLKCLPAGGAFELTAIDDDPAPPYAILSHTWTAGQEVTYKELLEGTGTNKLGYTKLCFCGERATADGLDYFWVNTYCIDKANSTELLEAVNSMFRWYYRAAKCYVHLTDVLVLEEVIDAEAFRILWE